MRTQRHLPSAGAARTVRPDGGGCRCPAYRGGMSETRQSLRSIVAGVDFTPAAEGALHRAADLAAAYGATLRVVHAFGWPTLVDAAGAATADLVRDLLATAESELERMVAPLRERGLAVHAEVSVGPAAAVVLGAARHGADLVVTGTRRLAGVKHALLGSTTQRVLERAPCPVLVVHEEDGRRALRPSRVLVATDLSSGSLAGVRAAASLLGLGEHDPLTLLHVCPPQVQPALSPTLLPPHGADRETVESLRWQLAEAANELRAAGLRVEAEIREGEVARTIVDVARERNSELVLVGTRGLTGLAHLLLGSTAARVVQQAPCPVLVVPAPMTAAQPVLRATAESSLARA